jgi:membrane protease YdiL (CAAX protease family)
MLAQFASLSPLVRWEWQPVTGQPGLRVAKSISQGVPARGLFLALAFAPLIRLVAFALPLYAMPPIYWYAAISIPLFVAAALAARTLTLGPASLGLQRGSGLSWQALIGLSGLALGYVEYRILTPAPPAATLADLWLPALVLLVSTGLLEELIFRGLMQRAAAAVFGENAIVYVAAVYALLHLGNKSVGDLVFAFVVGLFFGRLVVLTRSVLGVALAHGLISIMALLVLPLLAVGGPQAGLSGPAAAPPPAQTRVEVSGRNNLLVAYFQQRTVISYRSVLGDDAADVDQGHHAEGQQQGHEDDRQPFAKRLGPGTGSRAEHLFLDQERQQDEDRDQAHDVGQGDIRDGAHNAGRNG